MRYLSTRGHVAPVGFLDAVMMGMADDGGLLVPETIPQIDAAMLQRWKDLSYQDLTLEILQCYVQDEISRSDLRSLINASYTGFRHDEVVPVRQLDPTHFVLELFHGPTFAFKDVALQFLGNLYAYIARTSQAQINILGATSGDTGASAIEGVRGKEGIRICILYPYGKVSKVQALQMTTVNDANVLNLAVEGSFDDCQRIIKDLFADVSFKRSYHLRAVNSINIARILVQSVYYFYAYFQLVKAGHRGSFEVSVPTGNFGDIFAGYLARRMGLPMDKLILATNENRILERFVNQGVYQPAEVRKTYSPSMDIQVASNFERYLYYLSEENPEVVRELMQRFHGEGRIEVDCHKRRQVQSDFAAARVSNETCLDTIVDYHERYGYLIDPHTACAAAAVEAVGSERTPTVILSTAHPAKFNEALALRNLAGPYPREIEALFSKPKFEKRMAASSEEIQRELIHFLG